MVRFSDGLSGKDEEPDAAVLRELKEEPGLDGEVVSQPGVCTFFQRNDQLITYHVRASGDIWMDDQELQAYKIVPINALKSWPCGTEKAVVDWLANR